MPFDWGRLFGELPNLFCAFAMLNVISFSFRSVSFGPLLLEARKRRVSRRYPLSDLVALMLMLQMAAGATLALARGPGVDTSTLAWNRPLDSYGTASVMIVLLMTTLWWWIDGTWMLNAAGVLSGWTRFTFLALWTPFAYISHWLIFFGGCGVLVTIASRRSGLQLNDSIARVDPIAYIGLFAFACLGIGLFGVIFVRWWSGRIADSAFSQHMSSFRKRLRELEKERAEEARTERAYAQDDATDAALPSDQGASDSSIESEANSKD